jgi:hypothetical protein
MFEPGVRPGKVSRHGDARPMPLRILVADDNEVVRSSIVRVLKLNPDVEVVGESINYAQTLELTAALGSLQVRPPRPVSPPFNTSWFSVARKFCLR